LAAHTNQLAQGVVSISNSIAKYDTAWTNKSAAEWERSSARNPKATKAAKDAAEKHYQRATNETALALGELKVNFCSELTRCWGSLTNDLETFHKWKMDTGLKDVKATNLKTKIQQYDQDDLEAINERVGHIDDGKLQDNAKLFNEFLKKAKDPLESKITGQRTLQEHEKQALKQLKARTVRMTIKYENVPIITATTADKQ